ncbi:hypothetical protein M5M_13355 [Simiduia agarivorans SA1 = DSM 21679]|uniref:Uncharacterized protein n=1 Tax=Simiduia agarivorans (strain DSM 21679 / JCM 13881 / BCRC 17597 / SA1) TaxID=1117647 RepID=K4KNK7_SIMAS|nr:hypothetical protein M5M_13355 [Simiduia agarivorans SA1 = DSM 21679]
MPFLSGVKNGRCWLLLVESGGASLYSLGHLIESPVLLGGALRVVVLADKFAGSKFGQLCWPEGEPQDAVSQLSE